MNYEWIGKTTKKSDPENRKNSKKIKLELSNVNKNSLLRKRIFVQKPFSRSSLKLELKI